MGCEELLCCLACGMCSLSVNLAVKSRKRKKKTRRKIGKDKMRFEGHLKRGYGVCIKLRCYMGGMTGRKAKRQESLGYVPRIESSLFKSFCGAYGRTVNARVRKRSVT